MDRKKLIYIGLILILTVIVSITYFSYAFFTHRDEQHGKLNIVAGTLNYKIESDDLTNNQITLEAGELKNIEIKLTSLNDIDSKYELYYETNSNVKVGYIGTIPKGTINKKEIKIFNIGIKNYSTSKTTVTFKVDGGFVNNELVKEIGTSIPIASSLCTYIKNQVFNFDYNGTDGSDGSAQTFDTDFCKGNYKVELWGAQGGTTKTYNISGGLAGYVSGNISLGSVEKFYIYVGGQGSASSVATNELVSGGYNGGGSTGGQACCGRSYGSGGGATDIRLTNGNWNYFDSLKTRIMVAGGGGGAFSSRDSGTSTIDDIGGAGGGLTGYNGAATYASGAYCYGEGAKQNFGGLITNNCARATTYAGGTMTGGFGYGGSNNGAATGGGSGYYGGGRSGHVASAGGGSSFISGYSGCNAIAESSTADNIVHTGQANHYSGYVFTNGVMIDGKGCNWSTGSATNCGSNQIQPDGTYAVGHTGNGFARITYLGE